jgi:hypothetical protein
MGLDDLTWQVLGAVLTVVGLALSALLWRRRGPAAGTRAAAWSLLPLAAALTGTLRLAGEIVDAVGGWATRLVLSPTVWLGIAVAGLSLALFLVSALLRRRTSTTQTAGPDRAPRGRVTSGGTPEVTSGPATGGDDMADIEAILRRHGIE